MEKNGIHTDVHVILESERRDWATNRDLQRARQAEKDALARCMKCHEDVAGGVISEEDGAVWLRDKGEPSFNTAVRERQRAEVTYFDKQTGPRLNRARTEIAARMLAHLAEAERINREELHALETGWAALVPKDIHRAPTRAAIPDLSVWVSEQRERITKHALLSPAVHETAKLLARPARPDYEPAVVTVIAAAAR